MRRQDPRTVGAELTPSGSNDNKTVFRLRILSGIGLQFFRSQVPA